MQNRVAIAPAPLGRFVRDDAGLSTVEYVIILVLLAVAAVGSWQAFGATLIAKLDDSNTTIRKMDGPSAAVYGSGNGNAQTYAASEQKPDPAPTTPAGATPVSKQRAAGKVAD
ncbi:MAG TPA: hypothetical protein VIV60_07105 [Polyangiaceae bacterium]